LKAYNKYIITISFLGLILYLFWISLPSPLFNDPLSTVILDKDNNLLGAHIANDTQWRFPESNDVPEKFKKAITCFEDKRFFYHPGIDPLAIVRAIILNVKSGEKTSGASTISMQVIRLSRKGKPRTIIEKIKEMYLAYRMEYTYSKKEILCLYASNAPFGGNIVGLDAASWRYFGRKPDQLSWSETCLLSVLPNSPALIHPGRNRKKLKKKRNYLLKKLYKNNEFDKETYELSIAEEIPKKPKIFPQHTPHLLVRINNKLHNISNKSIVKTTIDLQLQKRINLIIKEYHKRFSGNDINNIAALVVEVETGNVLSYNGNIIDFKNNKNGNQVDIITSERSTGSVLKPYLYAAMLTSGEILPNSLVPDIPTYISGYSPRNYNLGYDGVVPAKRAIARSLNIPAIRMLQKYGIEKFIHVLKKVGLTTINKTADYYGLSLILGGCEGELWELVGAYASMSRVLNHYANNSGKYNDEDYFSPNYNFNISKISKKKYNDMSDNHLFSASSLWFTFNAMLDVDRPDAEGQWQYFSSSRKIAWKTGTSFGFRDGWAIGLTPDHVVGVWVGNADGEGRPKLTGINTAAPVLFDIFDLLPDSGKWFEPPYDNMIEIGICHQSGFIASDICINVDTVWIPVTGIRFEKCPYHKLIHLDKTENYRVHSDCEEPSEMIHKPWFILPPTMEWYYKSKNAGYKTLPPFREDCKQGSIDSKTRSMAIIYPADLTKIYVPVELDGTLGNAIFEAAHRKPNTTIFWHVDDKFIGKTIKFHHIAISSPKGKHILTLIDADGEKITREFEIIDKEKEKK